MDFFGVLLLGFAVLALVGLSFVTFGMVALQARTSGSRKPGEIRNQPMAFAHEALERFRAWMQRGKPDEAPRVVVMPAPVIIAPVVADPVPAQEPVQETCPAATSIGKMVIIKGHIISREDVEMNGSLNGTLEAPEHRVTVGPDGRLEADIKARELVVHGQVCGRLKIGEKVDFRSQATFEGDIKAGRIAIEDGAYLQTSVDLLRPEQPRKRPPRKHVQMPLRSADTRLKAPVSGESSPSIDSLYNRSVDEDCPGAN